MLETVPQQITRAETMQTNKRTPAENVALDFILSDYPQNLTFAEILDAIENKAETVIIWQPFENFDSLNLTAELESLKTKVENAINDTNKAA